MPSIAYIDPTAGADSLLVTTAAPSTGMDAIKVAAITALGHLPQKGLAPPPTFASANLSPLILTWGPAPIWPRERSYILAALVGDAMVKGQQFPSSRWGR